MVSNIFPNFNHSEAILIEIQMLPLEEEKDDFDTLSAVEEVMAEVKNEIVTLEGYSVVPVTRGRSGGEVIQLISQFVQNINENKELLALLGALTAVIRMLKKWRQVKKMELKWGSKTLIVEDADSATVDAIIKRVQSLMSDETAIVEPVRELKVKAKVSKRNKPEE
jgi:hypothetical protein